MKSSYWIVLVVLAVVLAGCTLPGAGTQAGTGPRDGATAPQESIKIGSLQPMTGEAASWGQNGVAGARMAVEEINAAGGVLGRRLELVAEDDKCSSEGVTAITKLINVDQVDAIIGPDCSASGAAALPVAQKAGVPVVIISASNPTLTRLGDYIFRIYPSSAVEGATGAEFTVNKLGKRKAAVIFVEDVWSKGVKDAFIARFKELGGQIAYEDSVTPEARDLKTQLTKAKNSGADVLYSPLRPAGGVALFQQAQEIGLGMPIVGGDFYDSEEVVKHPASEGVYYTVPHVTTPDAFAAKVKAMPGNENLAVFLTAPIGYDAVKILVDAMHRAGSTDKLAVMQALKLTKYSGVSNPDIDFDEAGDLKNALMDVKVVRGGKGVLP
ncbi:MAG: ABC transporter substrate-binding protein [Candidatus Diapherotrites archaeon]|uniref:ABC transporter substrate-binding protein n=1 Tax=Candidatus Iainarchaeum sp. TaxID=3101447 RepID=A0A8T4LHI3_9ARCH|nr:ABC transporter substrate-binding protein [Candidatus Diapherotrites archaeon]